MRFIGPMENCFTLYYVISPKPVGEKFLRRQKVRDQVAAAGLVNAMMRINNREGYSKYFGFILKDENGKEVTKYRE